ncbi:hypothetical protein O181_065679 [Austropuccinia psidii MF-1]|uniref:Uncharacterized protein n=1 Tax=Austropuccinia psidii MF-1 TaxID=1389203 RepID=A0A9Q3ERY6_9BASI|nr:hypothetical protein [Austropuccinia psidii MF-1]
MYGGMPPYACPGSLLFFAHKSLCLSRIMTLQTQMLTHVQDPNASHANTFACTGSQNFKQLLMLGQPPNTPTLPYAGAGSRWFTRKSLGLYRFPTIQTIP